MTALTGDGRGIRRSLSLPAEDDSGSTFVRWIVATFGVFAILGIVVIVLLLPTLREPKAIRLARELIEAKAFQQAIEVLQSEFEQDPTNAEAALLLGQCYLSLGDVANAAKFLKQACLLDAANRARAARLCAEKIAEQVEKGQPSRAYVELVAELDPAAQNRLAARLLKGAEQRASGGQLPGASLLANLAASATPLAWIRDPDAVVCLDHSVTGGGPALLVRDMPVTFCGDGIVLAAERAGRRDAAALCSQDRYSNFDLEFDFEWTPTSYWKNLSIELPVSPEARTYPDAGWLWEQSTIYAREALPGGAPPLRQTNRPWRRTGLGPYTGRLRRLGGSVTLRVYGEDEKSVEFRISDNREAPRHIRLKAWRSEVIVRNVCIRILPGMPRPATAPFAGESSGKLGSPAGGQAPGRILPGMARPATARLAGDSSDILDSHVGGQAPREVLKNLESDKFKF